MSAKRTIAIIFGAGVLLIIFTVFALRWQEKVRQRQYGADVLSGKRTLELKPLDFQLQK